MMKKLFDVSAMPARALYQAANAARIPKAPPALMQDVLGCPPEGWRYPMASRRNARSSVKNKKKKATVDLNVQNKRRVVKMNHP